MIYWIFHMIYRSDKKTPDHLGSTNYVTGITGQITEHIETMAFGEILFEEHSSSFTTPYIFTGLELDRETNLTYASQRYLDMKTSIFVGVDKLAEKYPNFSGYIYAMQNPIRLTDPTGMSAEPPSTHTDERGNVVGVYDDGDLGVYKHTGNAQEAKKAVEANYSSTNTSAGGEKMGETWTSLGFADFKAYGENGTVKPGLGAKIDFNSNWASEQVGAILNENPTLLGYADKARGGHDWDVKSHAPGGNVYFGSKLFGKFASARDAGNFTAGAVAQGSIMPNAFSDYGFGTYNASGNSVFGSVKMIATDLIMLASPLPGISQMGAASMNIKANFGEHPLSRSGIEAGKKFIQSKR
ncbi:hypothetical protein NTJ12_001654 [Flavobacterium psychrophilum]|nr:hypothetical protein [Flavobacterium psychrophilum]